MNKFVSFILLILAAAIVGCTPSSEQQDGPTIYTSIYPIQYITERIVGDSYHVETVYPPGVDAHTYEPTSKEMTRIADSDAFIYMGAGMEGFAESAADALKPEDVSLIELGKHEELFSNHANMDNGHNHSDHDPHIWLDPIRMIEMAGIIKGKLMELNPDKGEAYANNFLTLKKDLLALEEQFRKTLDAKKNKIILVSHAAYGYWEDRYGIKQIAISGLTSSDEPSQKELTEIVDQAQELNLKYVIYEQNGSDKVSKVIQDQIGASALHIHNLAVLTDKDIENHADYLSLMNHNLDVLDKALAK